MMLYKNITRSSHFRSSALQALNTVNHMKIPQRGYFSLADRIKDKFWKPYRHVQSFFEPDGINNQS